MPSQIADLLVGPGKVAKSLDRRVLLAEVPVERDALEQELLRAGEIVIGGQGVAEPPERVRGTRRVPELPVERETFFRPFPRDRNVSRDDRESGRSVESLTPGCGRAVVAAQQALEPPPAFGHVPSVVPEVRHRACDSQGELQLAEGLQPLERGAEVVVLSLQPVEPLLGALAQPRLGRLHESEEVLGMASVELLGLARFLEPAPAYSRIVSSIQNRSSVCRSRLLSTSDWSVSRSASATCSASASVQPPAKAESLAKASCSAGVSSS